MPRSMSVACCCTEMATGVGTQVALDLRAGSRFHPDFAVSLLSRMYRFHKSLPFLSNSFAMRGEIPGRNFIVFIIRFNYFDILLKFNARGRFWV